MKLYTLMKYGHEGRNLCVVDDQTKQLYIYVPNFNAFHHDEQMEHEFYFPDPVDGPNIAFNEVSTIEAANITPTINWYDSRIEVQSRLLNEYNEQKTRRGTLPAPLHLGYFALA